MNAKQHKVEKKIDSYEAARTYWEELRLVEDEMQGIKSRSWKETALKLGLPDATKTYVQNHVARKVRDYEKAGLVKHVVLRPPDGKERDASLPLRKPDLEQRVGRHFQLREAVVVDLQAIRQAHAQRDKDELHGQMDSLLHQELAICAAHVLKSLLRKTDVIGVGSGRAPLLTVRRSLSGARCDRVVSLCGQLSTSLSVNAGEFDLLTDADNVAFALANALGSRPLLTRVALAPRKRDDVKKHRETMRESWDKVTLALVGVGALAGKHPLSRYEESDDVAPVKDLLRCVWESAQEADRRTQPAPSPRRPHWIGDILNHLFVAATTRQTEWKELPEDMRRALSHGVRRVNQRTITAGPEVLSAVCERGAVILVAGGCHKFSMIQHAVLQQWVTHLVTDDETAAQLLASETAQQR